MLHIRSHLRAIDTNTAEEAMFKGRAREQEKASL